MSGSKEIVQWKEEYRIGIPLIDSQHKKLVYLLNELYVSMRDGRNHEALKLVLMSLIYYADFHFKDEEELMKKNNYAGYLAHKKEHDAFREKVFAYKEQFDSGRITLSVQLTSFLRKWLINHILVNDKKINE